MGHGQYPRRRRIDAIVGVRIIYEGWDPSQQFDIILDEGKIKEILPHTPNSTTYPLDTLLDAQNHLIAPSLCHAHVHLDKCFLLSDPKYADLELTKGDFAEAMELTSKAKARFEEEDLFRRGRWLISESIAAGVTHMRAFVEVDRGVGFTCLDAAIELKKYFRGFCEIQICAFAQDPICTGPHAAANMQLMKDAVAHECVDVVGSTPYVEDSDEAVSENYNWSLEMASRHKKHLDLHLDYHLDQKRKPVAPYVIQRASEYDWGQEQDKMKSMVLGHCTRLTQYSGAEWHSMYISHEFPHSIRKAYDTRLCVLSTSLNSYYDYADLIFSLDLKACIAALNTPVSFVGLPTSDLFMMGKPNEHEGGGERVRGTLQIPQMIKQYGLNGAISINNVGNAFTPQGTCDPLNIASMGVGLYHAGTKADARLSYECVSTRAKAAIGYATSPFAVGSDADFVLFEMGGHEKCLLSRMRGRRTLQEVVYDPPKERKTIFRGHLIIA